MKAEAIPIGHELVGAGGRISTAPVRRSAPSRRIGWRRQSAAIGEAQSRRLRATHLKYHLLTPAILTESQMRRYAELQGLCRAAPASTTGGHHPN